MKPRRIIRMFQPRFADEVATGRKRQTVRPTPKVVPRVGDLFEGRAWIGSPYRSKPRNLVEGVITQVAPVILCRTLVKIGRQVVTYEEDLAAFAQADGFSSWSELVSWFAHQHGKLPFRGILICWEPKR
jgi:hypothetical protein